jgi:hypothetical protein
MESYNQDSESAPLIASAEKKEGRLSRWHLLLSVGAMAFIAAVTQKDFSAHQLDFHFTSADVTKQLGLAKSTYSANNALLGLAFNLKYFPVYDTECGDHKYCCKSIISQTVDAISITGSACNDTVIDNTVI